MADQGDDSYEYADVIETWYELSPAWAQVRIKPVLVESSTELSVKIGRRITRKRSGYLNYFHTYEGARLFAIEQAEGEVEAAEMALRNAHKRAVEAQEIPEWP